MNESSSTILGPDGQPMPRRPKTEEMAAPTLTGVRSIWTEPVASGLTPQRLARIMRETAEPGGDARDYLTLAEEIEEREPHYRTVLSTRKMTLRALSPVVEAATEDATDIEIADAVRRLVATPRFRAVVVDLADAIAKGYSVVEMMWSTASNAWSVSGFKWRDPRFFQFDRVTGQELRLREDGNIDGVALPPAKFIAHVPKLKSGIPIRNGLARVAMWVFMLKSYSLKDWMAFLDVYGIPWRIGKWHAGASETDKRALLRAVANIASDGAAIVPESMIIELLEAKTSSHTDAFERLCKYLDGQISKLVLGQTMTTDDGASLSQAKIHDEVRRDLLRADADELAATVQRDLIEPFVHFNHGAPPNGLPRFTLPVIEPEDLRALMVVTGQFVDRGGRVSMAEVRDKLGWSDPAPDEDVMRPIKGTAADTRLESREKSLNGRMRPCPHCGGQKLAIQRATAASDIDVEVELEALANATVDWEPIMTPIVDPLLVLAREAASFDELLERLPEAARGTDTTALVKRLERAAMIARGIGDVSE